jgi:hypothetical protein
LKPGTGYHYKGVKVSAHQRDDETVTHQTRKILGIPATVVRDIVSQNGNPVERTLDYYAQDKQGNVWYMGELSLEKKNGRMVKASDSWLSGVKGGQPGVIMPANPQPGDKYRQERPPSEWSRDTTRSSSSSASRTTEAIERGRAQARPRPPAARRSPKLPGRCTRSSESSR